MFELRVTDFDTWLRGYKNAWEKRDPAAAAALFTPDAEYYWTPFDPPHPGRPGIAGAWEAAVANQKDVTFEYSVVAVTGASGIARWHTRFTSVPEGGAVELDGVFITEFVSPGQCRTFREWWHVQSKPT